MHSGLLAASDRKLSFLPLPEYREPRLSFSHDAGGRNMENALVRVNDVDLNVVTVGRGAAALVFLHYWGGSSRTWAPVMEHLASSNRCVAIDFRGWGESSKAPTDYTLETLANDVI